MAYKPLLRWAGGKRWLTSKITTFIPNHFKNYYEPFCGSCAIYFALYEHLSKKNIYLSDTNEELINFYKILQKHPDYLIAHLKQYKNDEETYYFLREKSPDCDTERASIFYFLNRTSFNGIYRVNLKGKYNVPFGFKSYKELFDYELIRNTSKLIKNVTFMCSDFGWIAKSVKKNDFIFLDPPYTVSHNNNGFIKYNQKLFSLNDQIMLKEVLDYLSIRNSYYTLTNAHHETIYNIFCTNSFSHEIERYTQISGKTHGRKSTKEYIFTNFRIS